MDDVPLVDGPVSVRGAAELERTAAGLVPHRLPARARAQAPDDFLRMTELQPSGVRLAFRTAARRLELDVRALRTVMVGRFADGSDGPVPAAAWYDLVVEGEPVGHGTADEHGTFRLDHATRRAAVAEGPVSTVVLSDGLPGREAEVEVWLPMSEVTTLVALRADAPVLPSRADRGPRWLHHGSSISHGAGAERPTGAWPSVAAREAGLDLVNLGLSGNAVLDPFVARALRDQPADVVSLKLGINVVNADSMRLRAFRPAVEGFLDTVREGHPTAPLLLVSPLLCPMVESCPGPTELDPDSPGDAPLFRTLGRPEELARGKLSLQVIRHVLADVVARRRAAGDRALVHVDGLELFGEADWRDLPMPDLLHPDGAGHRLVGSRMAERLRAVCGATGAAQVLDGSGARSLA